MMDIEILKIFIKDSDYKLKSLDSANLLEDIGIEGNSQNKKGLRQISILADTLKGDLDLFEEEGICFERIMGNFLVNELDLEKLCIGDKLNIGDIVLEISELGKVCYPNCKLIQNKTRCPIYKGLLFAKVVKGGQVKVGDKINLR